VVERVLLCREGAHTVPKQDEWKVRILSPGKTAQTNHVLNQQVKTAFAEIPKLGARYRRAAMSAMIVSVNGQAVCYKEFNRLRIPSDVFAYSVCDLNYTANATATVPSSASYAHSIPTREPKFE
jgi:hypothetical protein